jgi:hypothetical protein
LRRVKEKLRSGELNVSGDQWPVFLYSGYNHDPHDPWHGLFKACYFLLYILPQFLDAIISIALPGPQVYLHVTQFCREETKGNSFR